MLMHHMYAVPGESEKDGGYPGTGVIVTCELWVPELKPRSSAKAAIALDS